MPTEPDSRPLVLVVDDDLTIAQMVGRVAEFTGCSPVIETSSLRAAEHVWKGVAAIITDYMMPGLDGLELLEVFRQGAPKVRRILLTAAPGEPEVAAALRSGLAQRVISKPPTLSDLENALAWLT